MIIYKNKNNNKEKLKIHLILYLTSIEICIILHNFYFKHQLNYEHH